MVIHVNPKDRIKDIKDKIRHRIGLPRAHFQLTYAGSVLEESSVLETCRVPYNSTLTCVSFRPNIYNKGLRYRLGMFKVIVEDLQGHFHEFEIEDAVTIEDLVPVMTSKICKELGTRHEDIRLLCNWDFEGPFDTVGQPKLRSNGTIAMRMIPEQKLVSQRQQRPYRLPSSCSIEVNHP